MSALPALALRIDALLPQTQCRQCGYAGCQPYADAIATGEAAINRCPPGGEAGIRQIAELLGREAMALDPDCGIEKPAARAFIDESTCIGCTKCIQACPVDAIVGSGKRMHTILADECTGCELCLAPCPVDCIAMIERNPDWTRDAALAQARADVARRRFQARSRRLEHEQAQRTARRSSPSAAGTRQSPISKAAVMQAIARGRAKQRMHADEVRIPTE